MDADALFSGDVIRLTGLRAETIVGTRPEERLKPRPVRFDLTLQTDLAQAGATDDLAFTVDYQAVTEGVQALARRSSFYLIEALAEATAQFVLTFSRVTAVKVTLTKSGVLPGLEAAAVTVVRQQTKGAKP